MKAIRHLAAVLVAALTPIAAMFVMVAVDDPAIVFKGWGTGWAEDLSGFFLFTLLHVLLLGLPIAFLLGWRRRDGYVAYALAGFLAAAAVWGTITEAVRAALLFGAFGAASASVYRAVLGSAVSSFRADD